MATQTAMFPGFIAAALTIPAATETTVISGGAVSAVDYSGGVLCQMSCDVDVTDMIDDNMFAAKATYNLYRGATLIRSFVQALGSGYLDADRPSADFVGADQHVNLMHFDAAPTGEGYTWKVTHNWTGQTVAVKNRTRCHTTMK